MVYSCAPVSGELISVTGCSSPAAWLVLRTGAVFRGHGSPGAGPGLGEVVFNTSQYGAQEILSDPSYCGQIVVLTTPHVGVVGVNPEDDESSRVWAEGVVVGDLETRPSNWRSRQSLGDWVAAASVPLGFGFDCRAIVLHLREHGAVPGVLAVGDGWQLETLRHLAGKAPATDGLDLTERVAGAAGNGWQSGSWGVSPGARMPDETPLPVVVLDTGVKRSILRRLVDAGAEVHVLGAHVTPAEVRARQAVGVVIGNGPGDPAAVTAAVRLVERLLGTVPILGICLGHQILALAAGARTCKLPFGHHGGNHPVRDSSTGEVWVTAQNHNYAVAADSLPTGCRVTMTNLIDGSVEGIQIAAARAEGIQFHPEAGPGPHDAVGVFRRFLDRCRAGRP